MRGKGRAKSSAVAGRYQENALSHLGHTEISCIYPENDRVVMSAMLSVYVSQASLKKRQALILLVETDTVHILK
jgi:hypothetical protein